MLGLKTSCEANLFQVEDLTITCTDTFPRFELCTIAHYSSTDELRVDGADEVQSGFTLKAISSPLWN
jgi:hypothetical protein